MMKKIILLIFLFFSLFIGGCGNETEKMCRIQIQSMDGTVIVTLEQQTQGDVARFFDEEHWVECESIDGFLTPKYIIHLYQEKTHALIQTENTYEKIIEYTIYEDSDIVKATLCKDMISGGFISEEDLTVYYMGSEDFFIQISNAAKP